MTRIKFIASFIQFVWERLFCVFAVRVFIDCKYATNISHDSRKKSLYISSGFAMLKIIDSAIGKFSVFFQCVQNSLFVSVFLHVQINVSLSTVCTGVSGFMINLHTDWAEQRVELNKNKIEKTNIKTRTQIHKSIHRNRRTVNLLLKFTLIVCRLC